MKNLGGMPKNDDGIHVCIDVEADPKELEGKENPLNWKYHPTRQLDYISASIEEDGWIGKPTYCANTDRLLDGHGRLKRALERDYKSIPVQVGFWNKEQGDLILAKYDNMGRMASVDANALSSLTEAALKKVKGKKKMEKGDMPKLGLLKDVHSYAQSIIERKTDKINIRHSKRSVKDIIDNITGTDKDHRVTGTDNEEMYDLYLREDIIFPCKGNQFGIPDLLESKIYTDQTDLPTDTFARKNKTLRENWFYCQGSRPFDSERHIKPVGGFLGFFTEDKCFERCYNDSSNYAEQLLHEKWTAIVEPDYSTYWDWPFAKRLWSVYRARWCCRYWQQMGMNIIPMIRRTNDLERDKWLYTSLPRKMPIGMMQVRMYGKITVHDKQYWRNLGASLEFCQEHNGLEFVLLYGNNSFEKYILGRLPSGMKYRFVVPYINRKLNVEGEYKPAQGQA